jgi:hypothetical protein
MCAVFRDAGASAAAKAAALRTSVENHGRLTKEACLFLSVLVAFWRRLPARAFAGILSV